MRLLALCALLTVGCASAATAGDWRGGRGGGDGPAARDPSRDHDRGRGGPAIIIEPNIDLSRPKGPDVNSPAFIMAELDRCQAAGIRLFVDCLRGNHSSVMIRRLEACVRSETIPDEPERVMACLPPSGSP